VGCGVDRDQEEVTVRRRALHTLIAASAAPLVVALAATPTSAAGATDAATDATFSRDVAPIFQRSCQRCHRPGTAAPMSLLDYESSRPWAKAIAKKVASREMPPWHIDRTIGEYDPDPSLSDGEIATVVAWVNAGAPMGDPADLPPAIEWPAAEDWEFGEPDLVVEMDREMVVPAGGPDLFPSFIADSGLTEDRYIRWIELKPSVDGRASVHHVIVYAIQDDEDYVGEDRVEGDDDPTRVDREGNKMGSLLIEYAVGNTGDVYSDGTAKLLMAGAKIRFSGHYHPVGREISDRLRVGFGFYPKGVEPPSRVISTRIFAGLPSASGRLNELNIPPGADNVRHDGYRVLPKPTKVISFQAHMHYRGKAMSLEAIHLDGRRELLTKIDNYDFNWQVAYPYKNPPVFPAGTVLHVTSWHDNSAANPHNPDPSAWVGWGNRTVDDMSIGWTNYVYLSDEQYQAHLAGEEPSATGQ
jgi:mono/diheme cytochrome c family protein